MMLYSQLRFSERQNLMDNIPLPGPLTIYLESTNVCNFRCTFCPESFENFKKIQGGEHFLDQYKFDDIIEQIRDLKTVKTLNFYMMGEPFVNKNLVKHIAHAKRINAAEKIIVTSNGSLIKEDIYEKLCRSQLDFLRISIYGFNSDDHKSITKSSVPLSRIKENILGLKQFRDSNGYSSPFIYIKMIDRGENSNQNFLDCFNQVGDEVVIEPVMNWNDPAEGNLSGLSQDKLIATDYFENKKSICPFPFYTLVVHADLRVSVCCVDWNKRLVVGDLSKQSLREIWHGSAMRSIQIKHLKKLRSTINGCRSCTYIHTAPDNLDEVPDDIIDRFI